MVYTPHQPNKAEAISAAFLPLIEDTLFLPNLFQRASLDIFKGSFGDKVTVSVPGVLRAHEYGFRNDRSDELVVDTFKERRISFGVTGDAYSAVAITDEQKDFDLVTWAKVMPMQADAVGEYLNRRASETFLDLPHPVQIGVGSNDGDVRTAINAAKLTLDRLRTGQGTRYLLVGSEFEAKLLMDPNLTLAQNVGDALASVAVQNATLGRIAGFTVISSTELEPDEAIACTSNAIIWYNTSPSVPNSVPYGVNVSADGLAMRHIMDYDTMRLQDRSVVNTWFGMREVTDIFKTWDTTNRVEVVQETEHYTRSVKLKLGAANSYGGAADLSLATGVNVAFLNKLNPAGTAGATSAPAISTVSFGDIEVGTAKTGLTLAATGTTPITWAIESGSLPAGLSLNSSTGAITGTPTTAAEGEYEVWVKASNSVGVDTKKFTGVVTA